MTHKYIESVEANLEGLTAVSSGVCPGCEVCRDELSPESTMEEFYELWSEGKVDSEASFAWQGCDVCGSQLFGNFECWHAIDEDGEIIHGNHCCVDCVLYLAYGDVPEDW